jgi:hypothetical protein
MQSATAMSSSFRSKQLDLCTMKAMRQLPKEMTAKLMS